MLPLLLSIAQMLPLPKFIIVNESGFVNST